MAAKVANMRQGERSDLTEPSANSRKVETPKVSQADAAKLLNVGDRIVYEAAKVLAEAPELVPAIEAGEMTVHAAARQARASSTTPPSPAPATKPPVTPKPKPPAGRNRVAAPGRSQVRDSGIEPPTSGR